MIKSFCVFLSLPCRLWVSSFSPQEAWPHQGESEGVVGSRLFQAEDPLDLQQGQRSDQWRTGTRWVKKNMEGWNMYQVQRGREKKEKQCELWKIFYLYGVQIQEHCSYVINKHRSEQNYLLNTQEREREKHAEEERVVTLCGWCSFWPWKTG